MSDEKKADDFVHLHIHSDYSSLDGAGRIDEYVEVAKKRGNKAIALTDHGTQRGYMAQYESCKKHEIKPIYGIEFYVSKNMMRKGLTDEEKKDITKGLKAQEAKQAIKDYEEREGIRDRWHTTVWAYNMEGLRNLFRLSTSSFVDGFYYKPRIDLDALERHKEGLMVATGCLSSPVNDTWFQGKKAESLALADRLHESFGERLWLEVQPHAIRDQRVANKLMLKLRDRYGGKNRLLACQDAHYVNQSDAEHHEVLLCIGTNTNLSDPDRFKFDGDEFHMRTRKEMFRAFGRHHEFIPDQMVKEALNSTIEFAEQCDVKLNIDYHAALLPDPGCPKKYKGDHFAFLKDLCLDGWTWRMIPARAREFAARHGISAKEAQLKYRDRLVYELSVIQKQHFVRYFLLIRDLYSFARREDIMTGPGRGSVAGSIIAFLLGITSVDPIEHGLIFERFINPDRIDMPDVDMDYEDVRRGEIIEYVRNKYGDDKVCQIATIGKLSGKQCLKDVARVLEVPFAEVNAVTASIIERSSGDERASATIEDSFKEFDVCREFDKKYPKVLHHARRLEGLSKTLGIHAAGVVASPVTLTDVIPLEVRRHKDGLVKVSAVDMYGVAANGLVKMDVLGLRTLTVLKDAAKMIKERHGRVIDYEDPNTVDLNDPKVLEGFTKHDYGGVFQYDTPGADKVCAGVNFTHFEDVAAMTALNRPGTSRSGLATEYVKRKKNPKLAKKDHFHPLVTKITSDTLGILVYQEHVLRIFTDCAGFAPGTADSLRKVIAKKIGDETLGKERARFVEGCAKHSGIDEKTANKIMDAITFFGSYGFNKSHATAYGMIAFWTMWCKTYYPTEFYWSLLKNEPDTIRVQQYAKQAKKRDINFLPPSVSESGVTFTITPDGSAIRGSLVDIKGVGEKAAAAIIATQPYSDMLDFFLRVDRRKVNKTVVVNLAKAGALDDQLPNPKWFVENIVEVWKLLNKKSKTSTEELRALIDKSADFPQWDVEERQLVASSVNPLAFGRHPIDAYQDLIENRVAFDVANMGAEDFFTHYDGKPAVIAGVVVEVKLNQIGDFHTGTLPSEEERERMFWGQRYANVNVEDASGKQNRMKFDFHIYPRERPLIEMGKGTPVIVHTTVNGKFENMRAQFAVALEPLRKKLRDKEKLSVWERIIIGDHPIKSLKGKSEEELRAIVKNKAYKKSSHGGTFYGIVTDVRPRYDRRGNLMAFFGLLGGDGTYIDVVCFGSQWADVKSVVKSGAVLKIALDKGWDKERRTTSHVFNGGLVKRFKELSETTEGGE